MSASCSPYTDAFEDEKEAVGGSGGKVHIRIQQRNRRKCMLSVTGLDDDLDLKKIVKVDRVERVIMHQRQ